MPLIEHIDKDNDDVCAADNANHFLAPSFSHCSPGDKSRNIKQLDLGPFVLQGTRDDRECGKLIRRYCTCRAGEFVEQRTFTRRGETNEHSRGIAGLLDRKAFSTTAGFHRTVDCFIAETCNLCLYPADMLGSSLVVRSLGKLCFQLLDLIFKTTHSYINRCTSEIKVFMVRGMCDNLTKVRESGR